MNNRDLRQRDLQRQGYAIEALLERGLERYRTGATGLAVQMWEEALAIDPDEPRALTYIDYVRQNWDEVDGCVEPPVPDVSGLVPNYTLDAPTPAAAGRSNDLASVAGEVERLDAVPDRIHEAPTPRGTVEFQVGGFEGDGWDLAEEPLLRPARHESRPWSAAVAPVEAVVAAGSDAAMDMAAFAGDDGVAAAVPIEALIEAAGEAPIEAVGEAPIEAAGEAPIEAVGEAPIEAAGEALIEAAGEAPIEAAGEAPIEGLGEAPIEVPIAAAVEGTGSVEVAPEDIFATANVGDAPYADAGEPYAEAAEVASAFDDAAAVAAPAHGYGDDEPEPDLDLPPPVDAHLLTESPPDALEVAYDEPAGVSQAGSDAFDDRPTQWAPRVMTGLTLADRVERAMAYQPESRDGAELARLGVEPGVSASGEVDDSVFDRITSLLPVSHEGGPDRAPASPRTTLTMGSPVVNRGPAPPADFDELELAPRSGVGLGADHPPPAPMDVGAPLMDLGLRRTITRPPPIPQQALVRFRKDAEVMAVEDADILADEGDAAVPTAGPAPSEPSIEVPDPEFAATFDGPEARTVTIIPALDDIELVSSPANGSSNVADRPAALGPRGAGAELPRLSRQTAVPPVTELEDPFDVPTAPIASLDDLRASDPQAASPQSGASPVGAPTAVGVLPPEVIASGSHPSDFSAETVFRSRVETPVMPVAGMSLRATVDLSGRLPLASDAHQPADESRMATDPQPPHRSSMYDEAELEGGPRAKTLELHPGMIGTASWSGGEGAELATGLQVETADLVPRFPAPPGDVAPSVAVTTQIPVAPSRDQIDTVDLGGRRPAWSEQGSEVTGRRLRAAPAWAPGPLEPPRALDPTDPARALDPTDPAASAADRRGQEDEAWARDPNSDRLGARLSPAVLLGLGLTPILDATTSDEPTRDGWPRVGRGPGRAPDEQAPTATAARGNEAAPGPGMAMNTSHLAHLALEDLELPAVRSGLGTRTPGEVLLRSSAPEALAEALAFELDRGAPAGESQDDRARRRITALLERASAAARAGEHPMSIAAIDLALSEAPDSAVAQKLVHRSRDIILECYTRYFGDLTKRPVPVGSLTDLTGRPIDPRAAFLVSRMDGNLSYEEILDVAGMGRLEACRHLAQLLVRGIIRAS